MKQQYQRWFKVVALELQQYGVQVIAQTPGHYDPVDSITFLVDGDDVPKLGDEVRVTIEEKEASDVD